MEIDPQAYRQYAEDSISFHNKEIEQKDNF